MAVAVVVVAIVVVITVVAIVGLLLLLGFSFGWHIFHGYDLLVVQGCWLKHPSEAAAQQLQQQQLKQNKCPVRSGQVTTPPPLLFLSYALPFSWLNCLFILGWLGSTSWDMNLIYWLSAFHALHSPPPSLSLTQLASLRISNVLFSFVCFSRYSHTHTRTRTLGRNFLHVLTGTLKLP